MEEIEKVQQQFVKGEIPLDEFICILRSEFKLSLRKIAVFSSISPESVRRNLKAQGASTKRLTSTPEGVFCYRCGNADTNLIAKRGHQYNRYYPNGKNAMYECRCCGKLLLECTLNKAKLFQTFPGKSDH